MYSRSADVYDLLYHYKDYAGEAEWILDWAATQGVEYDRILDAACGTGEHDRFLARDCPVDGFDLDPALLETAMRKNRKGVYAVGDLCEFTTSRQYGLVVCLFSSIGYVRTRTRLTRALRGLAAMMEPGGALVIEPWMTPESWVDGVISTDAGRAQGLHAYRMMRGTRVGRISRMEAHYLVGTPEGIEHRREIHRLGLFTMGEMMKAFRSAGLTAAFDPIGLCGRGVYTARHTAAVDRS